MLHQPAALDQETSFRVSDHIGTVELHELRLHKEPRFTGAGTADDQHVFVPGGLGVFGAVVHGEAFRLGQENVVIKHRVDVRGYIFGAAPPGTAVFYASAVFLGVLALAVHHQTQCHRTGHTHRQIEQVEAGGGVFKGKGKAVRKVQQLF